MLKEAQGFVHGPHPGIGTKVPGTVLDVTAGDHHPGEIISQGNFKVRVALVIFVLDVVTGAVLLDQVLL
ncbi:MAG: hypothetical protein BWY80_00568 [Firmicutes bacterium ADurb.Bin456]|nr:MAG: hypothetical protein BWY80_00568 [Firmicutes bacterium ADurb.Bin456]